MPPALAEERTEERAGPRFRPTLWATLFTALAVAIMVGLGTWQVQRLAWKTALIERVEAGMQAAPLPLPAHIEDPASLDFRRAAATGRFLHDHELHLAARSYQGRVGYQIVTPLQRDDGAMVLVNRGWVPTERRDPASRQEGQLQGTVTVEGIARVPAGQGWMQPDNTPATNMWFWYDVPAMARQAGNGAVLPVVLEAGNAANPGGFPVGGQTHPNITNNHLQYAITWYSLAVTLLVIYVVFHRRRDP